VAAGVPEIALARQSDAAGQGYAIDQWARKLHASAANGRPPPARTSRRKTKPKASTRCLRICLHIRPARRRKPGGWLNPLEIGAPTASAGGGRDGKMPPE